MTQSAKACADQNQRDFQALQAAAAESRRLRATDSPRLRNQLP